MDVAARVAQAALTSLVVRSVVGCDNASLFTIEDDPNLPEWIQIVASLP